MADKKSKVGQDVNTIRETIKQKKISETLGESEAEKLFRPITKGLKDLAGPNLKKLVRKKAKGPDYGLKDDDVLLLPDYNIGNLFDDEDAVEPQEAKQIMEQPPSYDDVMRDVLKEAAFGKKDDPNDEDEDEDEEEEVFGPDYSIHEEDEIDTVLSELDLPKYDDIQEMLREDLPKETKQENMRKIQRAANFRRNQLKGYKTKITKQLNKGTISKPEAQIRNKVIADTKKVLDDYINFSKSKTGSGLGGKPSRRGGSIFIINPTDAVKKLELIIGSIGAGNNNIDLRNTGVAILDILLKNSIINKPQYKKIYKNFFDL